MPPGPGISCTARAQPASCLCARLQVGHAWQQCREQMTGHQTRTPGESHSPIPAARGLSRAADCRAGAGVCCIFLRFAHSLESRVHAEWSTVSRSPLCISMPAPSCTSPTPSEQGGAGVVCSGHLLSVSPSARPQSPQHTHSKHRHFPSDVHLPPPRTSVKPKVSMMCPTQPPPLVPRRNPPMADT